MDWLPQPFTQLSGPAFLLVYAAFAAAIIVISRWQVTAADRSLALPLPAVSAERDPFEVAYLRGGGNELLRFAIFDAIRRGLLHFVASAKPGKRPERIEAVTSAAVSADETPLVAQIVRFYESPHTTDELFNSPLPKVAAEYGAARYDTILTAERFLPDGAVRAAATRVRLYGAGALLAFAGLRLADALARHHRNIGFLIVLALLAIVALVLATRVRRLSRRGRAFLKRLQTALAPARSTAFGAGAVALPIFIAATGMEALAGTQYAPMNQLFRKRASSGGCDGGSNSCGSGSGSSGGSSSCGSGGGCGGGCGG